jgi:RNA polymerase sigma-70 factor (ECF subfamily)
MDDVRTTLGVEALRHLDALFNLARWLARDPVEAEDLVQETYLRAIRAAHQFQPGTNLRAWLFQILRNHFLTARTRRRREPEPMDPGALEGLGAMGGAGAGAWGPGGRASQPPDATQGLDLTAALSRLPEEFRSVVLLADLEDFRMEEIAQIMGCPVGTVKSRLFRARAILRGLLRDYRP